MVRSGIREFVYDIDVTAFLKRNAVVIGIGNSEFTNVQEDWCQFTVLRAANPFLQHKEHCTLHIGDDKPGWRMIR